MASSTQQQQKHTRADSALYLNDLVSLPIIITDFDAASTSSTGNSGDNNKKSDDTPSPQTSSSDSNPHAGEAAFQKWSTGFNDFADEMWKSMTTAMRSKLREAAVEVLKRTDDTKSEGELWAGEWDEDARFLD